MGAVVKGLLIRSLCAHYYAYDKAGFGFRDVVTLKNNIDRKPNTHKITPNNTQKRTNNNTKPEYQLSTLLHLHFGLGQAQARRRRAEGLSAAVDPPHQKRQNPTVETLQRLPR